MAAEIWHAIRCDDTNCDAESEVWEGTSAQVPRDLRLLVIKVCHGTADLL